MSLSIDEPANSRLFVVAGRSTSVRARRPALTRMSPPPPPLSLPRPSPQAEFLRSVFEQFGSVQFVKYLREKGQC